jgi:hypothetical protein
MKILILNGLLTALSIIPAYVKAHQDKLAKLDGKDFLDLAGAPREASGVRITRKSSAAHAHHRAGGSSA